MPINLNDTVYEEAKKCYNCLQPGKFHSRKKAPNGNGHLEFYECTTEACKVFINGGTWVVQIDRTGAIPVRNRSEHEKQFEVLDSRTLNRASSLLDEAETPPTDEQGRPEINNPWSPRR